MITAHPERTRERIEALEAYFAAHVHSGGCFLCRHQAACRASRPSNAFYEGQLPHVGRYYDLEIEGFPTRVVIVGQEYGTGERLVELSRRSSMIGDSARSGFRRRNPHMKGTTSQLRLLLGREIGDDGEGERLLDGHVFDGFALVNYLLCSSLKEARGEFAGGAGKGDSSPTMRQNCGEHFVRTLEILQPTLILVQGQGVRRWIGAALRLPATGQIAERASVGEREIDVLTFDHPSAGGRSGYWGNSTRSQYLVDVVQPAIRLHRSATEPE